MIIFNRVVSESLINPVKRWWRYSLWGFFVFLLSCSPSGINTERPVEPAIITQEEGAVIEDTEIPDPSIDTPTEAVSISQTPDIPTETPAFDYFSSDYELSSVEYTIPLAMRYLDEHEIVVFFALGEEREGKFVLRSNDEGVIQQFEIPFSADKKRHLIKVTGLLPERAYIGDVFLAADAGILEKPIFVGEEWGVLEVSTKFVEPPLRVGVLGDASFGDQATSNLIEQVVEADLDFVILTGDVVYVYPEDTDPTLAYVQKFFLPFSPLLHQLPVYTVLGNHDYDAGIALNGQPFYDYAFPGFTADRQGDADPPGRNQYYSLAYQDVQFLFLDSQTIYGVPGREAQEAWLDERLADSQYRFSIPILHVSPFSSSVVHPDDQLPIRYTWASKFAAAKVPVVFSGHFHHYERSVSEGVTYIVSGGGSSILYAVGELLPESQIYLSQTHFVLMEIYTDRIELLAISPQGERLDQAVIAIK